MVENIGVYVATAVVVYTIGVYMFYKWIEITDRKEGYYE